MHIKDPNAGKWLFVMSGDGYCTKVVEGDLETMAAAFAAFHFCGPAPAECADEIAAIKAHVLDEDNWSYSDACRTRYSANYEDGSVEIVRMTE